MVDSDWQENGMRELSIASFKEINVKKLQFIHTLTATDVHASKTAKIKKLYTMPLHIDV